MLLWIVLLIFSPSMMFYEKSPFHKCSLNGLCLQWYSNDNVVITLKVIVNDPFLILQWKPLNGITLGQRQTDSDNRSLLITEWTKHMFGTKW
jgi:hypothetical protein